jgi:glycosyltransferase involved in cell wall biosynthesis
MRWLFVPALAGKPWNGATIHTEALGGSEAAVAYLARSLAKLGEHVEVITHGTPGTFEDVVYHNHTNGNSVTPQYFDVVVVSRWLEALNDVPWNAPVRLFWIHDLPQQGMAANINAHRVVAISKFQQQRWALRDDVSVVIGDGVDLNLFKNGGSGESRDENRLIWASNPDRGLAIAARIYQDIRQRWPDMELHVYGRSSVYGWGAEVESPYLPRDTDMEGVVLHDSLPRYALAAELRRSWAMFYPTYWPETFCMATLEAQAAGLPVITVPEAALPETVLGGILTYDFLNAVSQLRNRARWKKLSAAGQEFAETCSWKVRAQQWLKLALEVREEADAHVKSAR